MGRLENMSETRPEIPARILSFELALEDYVIEIKKAVIQKAKEKGYFTEEENSGRNLYDFIGKYASGHSIGEIIYKAIRWTRKHDPEDLVKIAAWAFLTWDADRRMYPDGNRPERPEPISIEATDRIFIPNKKQAHALAESCVWCNYTLSAHIDGLWCPLIGAGQRFQTKADSAKDK